MKEKKESVNSNTGQWNPSNQSSKKEKKKRKRMNKSGDSLRDSWNTIKYIIVHIIGIPERENSEKGTKTYLKK